MAKPSPRIVLGNCGMFWDYQCDGVGTWDDAFEIQKAIDLIKDNG